MEKDGGQGRKTFDVSLYHWWTWLRIYLTMDETLRRKCLLVVIIKEGFIFMVIIMYVLLVVP